MVERVVGGKALPRRGRRADRGQDRRRAAVRRGADQDRARVGPARRTPATTTSWPARCRRSRSRRRCTTRCWRGSTASRRSRRSRRSAPRIGREFSHALLAAVADRPEAELQAALDQLVAAELVFRRGTPPEATYMLQARAGAGRRLRHPAQVPPPATPRRASPRSSRSGSPRRPMPTRAARPSLHRRRGSSKRRSATGTRPGARRWRARRWSKPTRN